MNVQPGQTPRIAGPVECAPLVRLCAQAALDVGARDVLVEWSDDFVSRQRYLKADKAVFSEFPDYLKANRLPGGAELPCSLHHRQRPGDAAGRGLRAASDLAADLGAHTRLSTMP